MFVNKHRTIYLNIVEAENATKTYFLKYLFHHTYTNNKLRVLHQLQAESHMRPQETIFFYKYKTYITLPIKKGNLNDTHLTVIITDLVNDQPLFVRIC